MKILKGDKGNIDFAYSLELTEVQREKLIKFLRKMFYHVEEVERSDLSRDRLGSDNPFNKEWENEEYELLFKIDEDNGNVARKLGRTWMSIEMKRVFWMPLMIKWASEKDMDIYRANIKKLVADFIKEHENEILKKRQERKVERSKLKAESEEFNSLKEEIPKFENLTGIPGFPDKLKITSMKKRFEELRKKLKEGSN